MGNTLKPNSLRQAMAIEKPLQIIGTINAYSAIMAKSAGFRAIYLSGAGVANASYGLPDLAMTNLTDVIIDIDRITNVCDLPLLVDADTGWGHSLNIARTVKEISRAGASGLHIEDQVESKRCGHRPGKAIVSTEEMVARLKAALDAREQHEFMIIARTDALAVESLEQAIKRIQAYVATGADAIFVEAANGLSQYKQISQAIDVPILANITEFGKTPLFRLDELEQAGVQLVLYPLSAFRAMNAAALDVYQTIRQEGTQKSLIAKMQTREELYELLNYYEYEQKL